MAKLFLRKKAGSRIVSGHPWVFANEIGDSDGNYIAGDIVEVYSYSGSFIGKGFINPASQIRVRLLSRDKEEVIDNNFFNQKIRGAWIYRQKVGYTENCRLVYGEADGLPGLTIDKFNNYFVIQSQSLGMDKWMDAILSSLSEQFQPEGIYERNDTPIRQLEGLQLKKGFLSTPFDPKITIEEHGLKFYVDIEHGAKTGYYLDQQHNRTLLQHIVKDAEVLDAFCYTGSYAIHAAHYGARSVLGIDTDERWLQLAKENAALNDYEKICSFQQAQAFDMLKIWAKEPKRYDVVILDPPPFAANKNNIDKALSGYKEINLRAMKLLRPRGFLVTTSCTHAVTSEMFREAITKAASDAGKQLRQVTEQTQSPDHPVIWNIPTTRYLKYYILQVL